MNKVQKSILIVDSVVITLIMLLPPSITSGSRGVRGYEYKFISEATIYVSVLKIQIVVVLIVSGLLYLAFKGKE